MLYSACGNGSQKVRNTGRSARQFFGRLFFIIWGVLWYTAPFWSHFYHFGLPFGVYFVTLGSFLEQLGCLWAHLGGQKTAWGPKVPQEPPKRRHPLFGLTLLETFWSPFCEYLRFFCKKGGFWNRLLVFFDFLVTLSAPRDGLICNPHAPAQSKHTFSLSHFFAKVGPQRPHLEPILEIFCVKNCTFEWKKGSKNRFKKRVPPLTQTRDYDHGPGLPDSPPRVRVFWTRNNCLSKKQEQLLISKSISEPFSCNVFFYDSMYEIMIQIITFLKLYSWK